MDAMGIAGRHTAVENISAVAWLSRTGITDRTTYPMASDALRWAAYTYVVAALGSLATLVYYILIFLGGRRD
jgi:Zn-dependent membrane protease YugP